MFCNGDINKFYKNVFHHTNTCMIGKKLMKHSYLKKEFYISLNMEAITDADYKHAKEFKKALK